MDLIPGPAPFPLLSLCLKYSSTMTSLIIFDKNIAINELYSVIYHKFKHLKYKQPSYLLFLPILSPLVSLFQYCLTQCT